MHAPDIYKPCTARARAQFFIAALRRTMTTTPDFLLFRLAPAHVPRLVYECGPFLHEDGTAWAPMSTVSAPHVAPGRSGVRLMRALPPDVHMDPAGKFCILALAPKTALPPGFVAVPVTEYNYLLTWTGPGLLELKEDNHGCYAPALDELFWGKCPATCSVEKNKFIWK